MQSMALEEYRHEAIGLWAARVQYRYEEDSGRLSLVSRYVSTLSSLCVCMGEDAEKNKTVQYDMTRQGRQESKQASGATGQSRGSDRKS